MTALRYDETAVIRYLARLSVRRRAAFAASCAERLVPAYVTFCERSGRGDRVVMADALHRAWQHVSGDERSTDGLREALSRCLAIHPADDGGPWLDEQPYADDAVSAITYTLRGLDIGDTQEFAWAARRAYDATAYHVTHRLGIESESRIVAHPIVQRELSRQRRDLEDLLDTRDDSPDLWERLRHRAREDAVTVFASAEA